VFESFYRILFHSSRFRTYILKRPGPEELIRHPKRILLTRLQNVGDMIVFLPTIRAFREAYPDADIRLLVKHPGGIEIIQGCPYLNGLIRVRGKGLKNKWALIREIRSFRPDVFVISTQDYGRVIWGILGGARVLIGYREVRLYGEEKREKLPGILYRSPVFAEASTELERNLELARGCGIPDPDPALELNWFGPEDEEAVDRLLRGLENDQLRVVLAPGTRRSAKAWMPERFAEVADALVGKYRARIFFAGGADEKDAIQRIQLIMRNESVSLAGQTTLRQLGMLFRRMDLLIAVDSGPVHLAAAVGTPYIALFGPGEFYKWRHTADAVRQISIYTEAPCSPCTLFKCADHRCMREITVSEVLGHVDALLASGPRSKGIPHSTLK